MVLQAGATPFKRTLHPPTREAVTQVSFPFFIRAAANPGSTQQRLEFAAPQHSAIAGAEITGLLATCANSEPVVVFMQLLDGEGRPSAHPIPLCVLSSSNAFSAKVQIPLNNPQKVNLFVVRSGAAVSTVTITGRVVLVDGNLQASTQVKTRMQKWMNSARSFEAVCKVSTAGAQKRRRSSSTSQDEPPHLIFAPVTGDDDES